jgi:cytosine/uracil/thiamine/allantoin permease
LPVAAAAAAAGMSWWQGVLTVFFGNLLTLVPMVLNAHPGTKYGVSKAAAAAAAAAAKRMLQQGSSVLSSAVEAA